MNLSANDVGVLSRHESNQPGRNVPMPASRWKTRVLLPGLILLAFGGILAWSARDQIWTATPVQIVPVIAKASRQTGGGVAFQAPGWVEADPYIVAASALTEGVVSELFVLEGDRVKKGQVVARLVDDQAKLAVDRVHAELEEREAERQAAQATLQAAQRDWDHPIERTRAKAIAQASLAEAEAELKKLEADLSVEQARQEIIEDQIRREAAMGKAAVAESQIVKTKLDLKTQLATIASVQASRPIILARIDRLKADLVAADENLALRIQEKKVLAESKAALARAESAIQRTRADLADADLRLKRMDIIAPVDGMVMSRLINPGDKLMLAGMDMVNSAHAVHLYDPKKLQVRVDVPLADAAKVSVEQDATIVVEVLPDRTFMGKVTRVVHEADIQKNTLQVKVAIHDPVLELKPEMLARVKFMAPITQVEGESIERLFVPENLVRVREDQSADLWLVDRRNHWAVKRTVKVGTAKTDGWVEILAGLQPGDQVIASDTNALTEGQRVHITGEAR